MDNHDLYNLGIKALVVNDNKEILLLQVNKNSLIDEKDAYWDIPGGRVSKNDSELDTLKRELNEELGHVEIVNTKRFGVFISNIRIPQKSNPKNDVGLILSVFVCKLNKTNHIQLSNEHVAFGWFTKDKAAGLLAYKYPQEFINLLSSFDF